MSDGELATAMLWAGVPPLAPAEPPQLVQHKEPIARMAGAASAKGHTLLDYRLFMVIGQLHARPPERLRAGEAPWSALQACSAKYS